MPFFCGEFRLNEEAQIILKVVNLSVELLVGRQASGLLFRQAARDLAIAGTVARFQLIQKKKSFIRILN
jgi:hypothetical protein